MAFIYQKISIERIFQVALTTLIAMLMVACGGGGGSGGAPAGSSSSSTTSTTAPTIKLVLLNSSGVASNVVTTSGPLTAQATVLSANGAPIPNTLVNFSTGLSDTTITPSSGAVLTNANGVATVTLSVANLTIAQTQGGTGDILTASAAVGTTAATATAPFSIGATAVTLSLVSPNPSTLNLSAYASTLIKVNVLANGAPYTAAPVTVNFSSACATSGKAVLPATATTVNGQAQVSYTDKGCSTTDTVTISVAGANSITATLVVAPPSAASVEFVSAIPAGNAIVIQGAGGNGRVETATLTFEALDTFGNPLPNETINFSVNSSQPVKLEANSAVTGTNGQAVVTVSSGTLPTTFRVIASLPTGQSTISDTISVTTGQPVQAAFSLSAVSSNIEGWAYDNTQTTLNILLADASGNPVADGTPVVFETDSGAVGSSTNGGCDTTNGGCSVIFRSQNPRFALGNSAGKRAGLGTVSVSTTSALYTLNGQIGVFLSGSFAENITTYYNNVAISQGAPVALGSNCGAAIVLQISDLNFNPLPQGTTISVTANTDPNTGLSTASNPKVFPSTVNNIGPHDSTGASTLVVANMAPNQGSIHTVQFTPGAGVGSRNACGNGANSGSLTLTITTPKNNVTQYTINFTYQ